MIGEPDGQEAKDERTRRPPEPDVLVEHVEHSDGDARASYGHVSGYRFITTASARQPPIAITMLNVLQRGPLILSDAEAVSSTLFVAASVTVVRHRPSRGADRRPRSPAPCRTASGARPARGTVTVTKRARTGLVADGRRPGPKAATCSPRCRRAPTSCAPSWPASSRTCAATLQLDGRRDAVAQHHAAGRRPRDRRGASTATTPLVNTSSSELSYLVGVGADRAAAAERPQLHRPRAAAARRARLSRIATAARSSRTGSA